jgi:putative colanic acid biosynthesis UDP-glucose lipid carrier transferase
VERRMTTSVTDFKSLGTELPLVALVGHLLAPAVCITSLVLCALALDEPFTWRYQILAIGAFLTTLLVFGELPLARARSVVLPSSAVLASWITVIGILLLLAFATKLSGLFSRKVVLTWFIVTPFFMQGALELSAALLRSLVSSRERVRSKIIVGLNDAGYRLADTISEDPCRGVVRGFFDDRSRARQHYGSPCHEVIGTVDDVGHYVKQHSVDVVYIAMPMSRDPRILKLLDRLRDTTASVYFVPSEPHFDLIQARVDRIGDVPVIAVCETPFCGINGVLKRAADIVIAALILLMIWPLMLAIAIGVRRGSPGPIFFRQRRYGLDGKEIRICKFRTMTVCEDGNEIRQATQTDQRVTAFGAFLRKTSLDELPQFFNVLAGTMSVVGPRPHAVAHNEQYRKLIRGYMLRHKVRPGITGWAQVNGCRGETETVEKMKRRVKYDLDYLKHWSLSLDLWIVLKTVRVVLHDHRNAY